MREFSVPIILGYKVFMVAAALLVAEPDTPKFDPVKAAEVGIKCPTDTDDRVPVVVSLVNANKKGSAIFEVTPAPKWEKKFSKYEYWFTGEPGTYTITALYGETSADGELSLVRFRATTVIIGTAPRPPPDPPGPKPPTPPTPQPTVNGIDLPGFHVLIVFDRDNTTRPDAEFSILYSEAPNSVRQYLKTACPAAPDGGMGYRIYPYQSAGVTAPWAAPFGRINSKSPSATISKNGKGWEGSIAGMTPEQFIAKCKEIEALP